MNVRPAKAGDLAWTFGAGATVVLAAVVPLYILPRSFGTSGSSNRRRTHSSMSA
jgi:hypothetical protein